MNVNTDICSIACPDSTEFRVLPHSSRLALTFLQAQHCVLEQPMCGTTLSSALFISWVVFCFPSIVVVVVVVMIIIIESYFFHCHVFIFLSCRLSFLHYNYYADDLNFKNFLEVTWNPILMLVQCLGCSIKCCIVSVRLSKVIPFGCYSAVVVLSSSGLSFWTWVLANHVIEFSSVFTAGKLGS